MNAQFRRYRQEIILNASAFSAAEVIDCARRPTDAFRLENALFSVVQIA